PALAHRHWLEAADADPGGDMALADLRRSKRGQRRLDPGTRAPADQPGVGVALGSARGGRSRKRCCRRLRDADCGEEQGQTRKKNAEAKHRGLPRSGLPPSFGNPAGSESPLALRPQLALGLPFLEATTFAFALCLLYRPPVGPHCPPSVVVG